MSRTFNFHAPFMATPDGKYVVDKNSFCIAQFSRGNDFKVYDDMGMEFGPAASVIAFALNQILETKKQTKKGSKK